MKRNVTHSLILLLALFFCIGLLAQTSDSFNSRPGVSINQVKSHLENHCWTFYDFDVNQNGWNAGIEGTGAMVSIESVTSTQKTGIYTPVLNVSGNITISFKYKFNQSLSNGARRWLKIYFTDHANTTVALLDSIELANIKTSTLYKYNRTFSHTSTGLFKLYINYQGSGGSARIAVDDLSISAPMVYSSGCNDAPVSVNDNISGQANRTASGNIFKNDHDPNNESLVPYIVDNSPNGNVTIEPNGDFWFMPNPGFKGSSTTFTYRVCDKGSSPLCSDDAKVTINFPRSALVPMSLVDFSGIYKTDGKIEISWATNFEQNSDRFEIERSFDGATWEKTGTLKAHGISSIKKSYNFTDNAGRNTASKKDLYYRLVQVDLDGRESHSRILVVRVYNTKSLKTVSVTPNPAVNDIGVSLQLNERSFIVMKIINNNGKEIARRSMHLSEGSNIYVFDGTSRLTPGMYFLEVFINSKERMIVKLIKE